MEIPIRRPPNDQSRALIRAVFIRACLRQPGEGVNLSDEEWRAVCDAIPDLALAKPHTEGNVVFLQRSDLSPKS